MNREDKIIQIISTVVLTIADIFILVYMYMTPYSIEFISLGPYAFPRGVLIIILILSVYHLIKGIRDFGDLGRNTGITDNNEKDNEQAKEWIVPLPAVVCMVSLVVYFVAWNIIGFSLSTIVYLTIIPKILNREEKIYKCLVIAVVITLIIDLLFVFGFGINLPDRVLDYLRYGM